MKIFFDLDGTLLDVSKKYYLSHTLAAKKAMIKPLSFRKYWVLKTSKIPENEIVQIDLMSKIFKVYETERVKLLESPNILVQDNVFPKALKLLEKLKKKHKLYLVTLRGKRMELEGQLNRLGIKSYFHRILSASSKKNPVKTKLSLLKKTSFNAGDVLIGDTEVDILVAKQLGIEVVAVASGLRTKAFLKKLKPDYLVDKVSEVIFLESLRLLR